MPASFVIRGLIILSWLALFGWHAGGYVGDVLGLTVERDLAGIVTAHVNKDYAYDLQRGDASLGKVRQSYDYLDGRYPVRFTMQMNNLKFLPMASAIAMMTGIDLSQPLSATMITTLNDRFRIEAVKGQAQIVGMPVTFAGVVDHRGLVGELVIADREPRRVHLEQVSRFAKQTISVVTALPPGLTVGERFRMPSLTPQQTPPYVRKTETTYIVEAEVEWPTRTGPKNLLRIRLERQGQALGTMYVDATGAVYELHDPQQTLRMVLQTIHHDGDRVWPPLPKGVVQ